VVAGFFTNFGCIMVVASGSQRNKVAGRKQVNFLKKKNMLLNTWCLDM